MKKKLIKKGEIIQRKGELDSKVYFVESGLLRSYCIDNNGEENIFMFAPDGRTIADKNEPEIRAELYIDVLEYSTVKVYEKDLKKEEKIVGLLVKRLAVLQARVIMLISTNAIERYEHFIKHYPDITKRVPQKMISSYLGVNPETLSAAKSKSAKNRKKKNRAL